MRVGESESTSYDSPKRFLAYTTVKSNDTLPQLMPSKFFAPFLYWHIENSGFYILLLT